MIPAYFPPARLWPHKECEPFETEFVLAKVKTPKERERPDGDTFDLVTKIRFDAGPTIRVRLTGESWLTSGRRIGFNAWERKGDERERGDAAYERRLELCAPGDWVRIRSFLGGARGSLNRWLCIVLVHLVEENGKLVRWTTESSGEGGWYSLADVLLHEGHGREWWRGWKSGTQRPRP